MRQQFPISQHSGVWQCRGTRWSISKPRNEISAALAPRCATFLPAARRRGGRAAALHSAVARVASWTAQDDGAACTPRHRSAASLYLQAGGARALHMDAANLAADRRHTAPAAPDRGRARAGDRSPGDGITIETATRGFLQIIAPRPTAMRPRRPDRSLSALLGSRQQVAPADGDLRLFASCFDEPHVVYMT